MKNMLLTAAFMLSGIAGAQTTKTFEVSPYDEIGVSGPYTIELVDGTEGRIVATGDQKDIDNLKITSDGGSLSIKPEKWTKGNHKSVKISIPVQEVSQIALSGSGSISSQKTLKATHFEVALSGSGHIAITVEAKQIEAAMSGSGRIELKGSSDKIESSVSGSGRIAAFDCKTQIAQANVAGSGECEVTCSDELTARISGSGRISYKGNPAKEDATVSGSGRISKS